VRVQDDELGHDEDLRHFPDCFGIASQPTRTRLPQTIEKKDYVVAAKKTSKALNNDEYTCQTASYVAI